MADDNIHVIGLGVTESANLSDAANKALAAADIIIGSDRQLETLDPIFSDRFHVLPKLKQLKIDIFDMLEAGKKIALLASGDPLFFGIGKWIAKQFPGVSIKFHPAVSSIQAACHRTGVSLQDVQVVSLHGRPLSSLRRYLKPNATLVILTDSYSHPVALAQECADANFSDSEITVCENLGYHNEKISIFSAQDLVKESARAFDPLHVSVIQINGAGGVLPQFPGFADTLFSTGAAPGKGMISKREARLQILSYLAPNQGDVIWDIGAGCGGVAVELAYWEAQATVYAIEFHEDRLKHLATNRERFGVVSNLQIIEGRAPDCLQALPNPNKVFIGGSDGELVGLLKQTWDLLPEGGCLVASAVIQKTKDELKGFAESLAIHQIESVELAVQRGRLENGSLNYQAKLPVEIFKFSKIGASHGG